MSKGNTFENDFVKLIFNGTAIPNIADNASVSPLTDLFFSLHTADVGESGTQSTSEANYNGYARVAVPRSTSGFSVVNNTVGLISNIEFPACTGGSSTITHFAIGTASTGTGKVLYKGVVSPTITVTTGVTPRINSGTIVTED
jgi:hypothetical protein